jgi:hypothetical protein
MFPYHLKSQGYCGSAENKVSEMQETNLDGENQLLLTSVSDCNLNCKNFFHKSPMPLLNFLKEAAQKGMKI